MHGQPSWVYDSNVGERFSTREQPVAAEFIGTDATTTGPRWLSALGGIDEDSAAPRGGGRLGWDVEIGPVWAAPAEEGHQYEEATSSQLRQGHAGGIYRRGMVLSR